MYEPTEVSGSLLAAHAGTSTNLALKTEVISEALPTESEIELAVWA